MNVCIINSNMVMCCVNNSTRIDTMVFFQETHTFAATVLVKDFGADPLRKFESGECAILAQELGADPLPEYKDGECTITHAIRRGPTFVEPSVELFVVLCTSRCPLAQRCGEQLINEDVGDDTVSQVYSCDWEISYFITHFECIIASKLWNTCVSCLCRCDEGMHVKR